MIGDSVAWVIRQTSHGVRSWRYDPSRVHMVVDPDHHRTRCGRQVGRPLLPGTYADLPRCRRCFR